MASGRIERESLDLALQDIAQQVQPIAEIKPAGVRPAGPRPATHQDFERLIELIGARATAPRSPRQHIADFIMPRLSDPNVLQGGRPLSILERLFADTLPQLEESEELRSLAGAIIADEIARHQDLLTRLHASMAA
jgi:hypothetical protein